MGRILCHRMVPILKMWMDSRENWTRSWKSYSLRLVQLLTGARDLCSAPNSVAVFHLNTVAYVCPYCISFHIFQTIHVLCQNAILIHHIATLPVSCWFITFSSSIPYHLEHEWKPWRKSDARETSSEPHTLHSSIWPLNYPLVVSWHNNPFSSAYTLQ